MKSKIRSLCPSLLLIALSVALGCSCPDRQGGRNGPATEGGGAATKQRDELVIHLEVEPAHLVYMLKPDAWVYRMTAHNVLEGLIRINPRTSAFEGELAKAWKVSADGLTYDFELRPGVLWHDGKPFSAADVKFTFDRLMDERVQAASTRASLEAFIDRYEIRGAHGFRIVCKKASFFFLQNLAAVMILPAHRMKHGDLNRHPLLRKPIGTGPYRFVSWTTGRQIVFERFDRYWGSKPAIRRLVWRIVLSPAVALRLARRGEIDFVPRVRPAVWRSQVLKDPAFKSRFAFVHHTAPGSAFVLINHRRPLLTDRALRRALAGLLDVETIVNKIMYGLAERTASLYWRNDPDFDPSIKPVPFDPAASRELLKKEGFADSDGDGVLEKGGKPLRLGFLVPAGSKSARRWLTLYQQQLRKAGIVLEIQAVEWAAFLQRIRDKRYDLAALGMQVSGSYTDLYLQLHSSQIDEGQNYAAYANPKVDRLLERIRTESTPVARKALTGELQRLLAFDLPVIPLFSLKDPGLVARYVQGVYTSDMWYQPRDWKLGKAP